MKERKLLLKNLDVKKMKLKPICIINNSSSSCINRAIDLNEIIQNIKLMNDYDEMITIDHTVQVDSNLYKALIS